MSIDIFYLKQKFRSKEISFDELLNKMGTEPETMSLNSMEVLSDFDEEISEIDREYLLNLIKLDETACKGFLIRCKIKPGERQGMLDVLINRNCYKSIISVLKRKDEVAYVIKKLNRPIVNDDCYTELIALIFNYYTRMGDNEPYKKRIFNKLLDRPDIIVDIVGKIYYRFYYNNRSNVFMEEEIDKIYKKNKDKIFNKNMYFDEYFNMCIVMFKYITDENRETLVYKALEERKVGEAKNILYQSNYRPILRLSSNLKDLLDSFVIMEELAG